MGIFTSFRIYSGARIGTCKGDLLRRDGRRSGFILDKQFFSFILLYFWDQYSFKNSLNSMYKNLIIASNLDISTREANFSNSLHILYLAKLTILIFIVTCTKNQSLLWITHYCTKKQLKSKNYINFVHFKTYSS